MEQLNEPREQIMTEYLLTLIEPYKSIKIVKTIENETNVVMTVQILQSKAYNIYFDASTFKEIVKFLFDKQKQIKITYRENFYTLTKHSNEESFFHLSILCKNIPVQPGEVALVEQENYKWKCIWFNQEEYKELLNRLNDILNEL